MILRESLTETRRHHMHDMACATLTIDDQAHTIPKTILNR